MLVGIVLDEALHRALSPSGPFAEDRDRHDVPAQRMRENSYAATSRCAQRAFGEVPQRPLATARLVDRGQLEAVDLRLHEERGVRRVVHPPDNLEVHRASASVSSSGVSSSEDTCARRDPSACRTAGTAVVRPRLPPHRGAAIARTWAWAANFTVVAAHIPALIHARHARAATEENYASEQNGSAPTLHT